MVRTTESGTRDGGRIGRVERVDICEVKGKQRQKKVIKINA